MRPATHRPTLDEFIRADPRIEALYARARRMYGDHALYHHSFEHVLRDLYRAMLIAQSEEGVDMSVLIPAVLLHDIGFCTPEWKGLGHDLAGARFAAQILPALGYVPETCRAICHCIRAHKGKAELPQSLEAKILYDADVLEKAALVFPILGGKIICEFGESLQDFLGRELHDRQTELEKGFYTAKARELDGGRLKEVLDLLRRIHEEITRGRPEFSLQEQDLWGKPPPR